MDIVGALVHEHLAIEFFVYAVNPRVVDEACERCVQLMLPEALLGVSAPVLCIGHDDVRSSEFSSDRRFRYEHVWDVLRSAEFSADRGFGYKRVWDMGWCMFVIHISV